LSITVNEVNLPPSLLLPTNRTIHAGNLFLSSVGAADPDLPANTLTYVKASGLEGLNVSATGHITWATTDADANTTNIVTIHVTDNGTPSLTTTNTFLIIVEAPPRFTFIFKTGAIATATWSAIPGTSYQLQFKTNLADGTWKNLLAEVTASARSASIEDSGLDPSRFYRLTVLP